MFMQKTLIVGFTLIITAVFGTQAYAQAGSAAQTPGKTATAVERPFTGKPAKNDRQIREKIKRVKGDVVRISEEEAVIVVRSRMGEETYDIKDVKWKLQRGAKGVKTGEIVVVYYLDQNGKKVAKTIARANTKKKKYQAPKQTTVQPAVERALPANGKR